MTPIIQRLATAPPQKRGKWTFGISIANFSNIMVTAFDEEGHYMIRFFTNQEATKEWVDGVVMGKYLD